MSYNLLESFHFIVATSMGASATSAAIEVKRQDNVGIQLNWTGTPTGTFAVQISADYKVDNNGNVMNAGNWISLPLSPAIAAAGSADVAFIDINQTGAAYIRVVYTRSSGTGVLDGYITAKGV